jgi:hypothetical protein
LAGPPTVLPGQGHGQVQEEAAGAGGLEEGAEEDEQDDVGHQHRGHDAEHAFLLEINMVERPVQGKAGVGEGVQDGHVVQKIAPQGIGQKHQAHDGHGPAQHPPGHLQGDQDAHHADRGVQGGLRTHAVVDGLVLNDEVAHHKGGGQGQKQIQGDNAALAPVAPVFHRSKEEHGHGRRDYGVDEVEAVGRLRAPGSQQKVQHKVHRHAHGHKGDGGVHIEIMGFDGTYGKGVVDEDQDVGDQHIEAQEILGVHRSGGAPHVKEHHPDAQQRCEPQPKTGQGSAGLGIFFYQLIKLSLSAAWIFSVSALMGFPLASDAFQAMNIIIFDKRGAIITPPLL